MPLPRLSLPAALLLLSTLDSRPAFAGTPSDKDEERYPIHVQIFNDHSHRHPHGHYTSGHGQGNVVEGAEIHAIDFDYECGHRFLDTEPEWDYPARWKKPGYQLEILTGVRGSESQTRTCTLKVEVKEAVYVERGNHVEELSPDEYRNHLSTHAAYEQAVHPPDVDPSHYPLQLAVLALNWGPSDAGMHFGSGQGNLKTPRGLNAVDFSLACPIKIHTTPRGRFLSGRWTQPNQLILLLPAFPTPTAPAEADGSGQPVPSAPPAPPAGVTCTLQTVVHPDIYIRQGGELKAVPQSNQP